MGSRLTGTGAVTAYRGDFDAIPSGSVIRLVNKGRFDRKESNYIKVIVRIHTRPRICVLLEPNWPET